MPTKAGNKMQLKHVRGPAKYLASGVTAARKFLLAGDSQRAATQLHIGLAEYKRAMKAEGRTEYYNWD